MAAQKTQEVPGGVMNGDFTEIKQKLEDLHAQTEDYVRSKPTQSVLSAIAAGFILRLLPVTAIVGMFVRLGLTLLKPAIFIFGAISLYKHFQGSAEEP